MDNVKEKKSEIRSDIAAMIDSLSESELSEKYQRIEDRLFEFANFLESKIVLLYLNCSHEVRSRAIVERCLEQKKIPILPAFNPAKHTMDLIKIDNLATDLKPGPRGVPEPDKSRCKAVPIERIDIAIIPGIAFDEKGARIGTGKGYYDRLIPKLPITTRKVSLALEGQIIQQVPMESHDKHVDIIITDERIIYKI
jgi:5-formyltetrahydrofolate cyclo-ligase